VQIQRPAVGVAERNDVESRRKAIQLRLPRPRRGAMSGAVGKQIGKTGDRTPFIAAGAVVETSVPSTRIVGSLELLIWITVSNASKIRVV